MVNRRLPSGLVKLTLGQNDNVDCQADIVSGFVCLLVWLVGWLVGLWFCCVCLLSRLFGLGDL